MTEYNEEQVREYKDFLKLRDYVGEIRFSFSLFSSQFHVLPNREYIELRGNNEKEKRVL